MIEEIIGGHKVELYDSIEDCPLPNYVNWGRCLLLDANPGTGIDGLKAKWNLVKGLNRAGEKEKVDIELNNMWMTIDNIEKGLDFKSLALCCLVKSIDGKDVTVATVDDAMKVRDGLKFKMSMRSMLNIVSAVKKKWKQRRNAYTLAKQGEAMPSYGTQD